MTPRGRLAEVAWVFLKLGTVAFGGPAAHVAMMEDEAVRRRGWVSREEFLDLNSATNFIPGPNSTELAIHLGYRRAGWAGILVGGVCFIAPAAFIVIACAWGYVRYGSLPRLESVFRCVAPVIVAIVALAVWRLGRAALMDPRATRGVRLLMWAIAIGALAATLLGVHELIVLGGAAVIAAASAMRSNDGPTSKSAAGALTLGLFGFGGAAASGTTLTAGAAAVGGAGTVGAGAIFWVFARIGSVLFGSGYVLLAFVRAELVERRGWLTHQQMLDAVAVGQFTPGPVFTTATFIGYLLDGLRGAAAATAGIFAPAFIFVALTAPLLPRLRRSRTLARAVDGVNAASLALMAAVWIDLARSACAGWLPATIAVVSLAILARWTISSAWLIAAAAAIGLAVAMC